MPPKNSQRVVRWLSLLLLTTFLISLSLLFIVHAATDEQTPKSSSHVHSTAGTTSSGRPQDERLKQILASPILSDFDNWVKKVATLNYSLNAVDIEKGRALAVNRRALFKELMSLSPKSALDHAVSSEAFRRMPASITTHLETPVSGYGDFKVYVVMVHENHHSPESMTSSRIEREVTIGTAKYKALVYGRRENITTKLNIPLHGIALDGVMVVDEEPVKRIQPSQYLAFNVERAKVLDNGAVAEIGGKLVYFSSPSQLETFVRDQIAWEAAIGPVREEESTWTEGAKTVLFIRIDFSDKEGEPVDFANQPLTVSRAQNLIDNEIGPFYENNSFNKTSLETTVTPVVRMPQPQSFYFTDLGALFRDAESAARSAGFEPNNFNLDIIAMSYSSGFGFGGVAFVGARGSVLNGFFDLRVTAHELGHNYGLLHANSWRTTDGSIIGPGNNLEYGNLFDVMGTGFDSRAHFSSHYKRLLDWLTDANVQVISQDGVYRVFAHDSTTTGGIRALKVRKNADKNYWIEFRQLFSDLNGAIINWDYRSRDFREIQILDMVPATDHVFDAALQVGSVFNDDENRIRISVLSKNNTTPESLDIKVELNVGCTFGLSQTSQSFTASGGEGDIPLTALPGCRPLATSNSDWIHAIQGDTSPVRYVVAANYDSSPRTGTITVNGHTFTVQQEGATTACAPVPPGLVAWWRGEGNGLDHTGTNHGALVNLPNFAGGKVGGGFSGNYSNAGGYVEVPDSTSLTLTKSITIEGWLKLNENPNGFVLRRLLNDFPFLGSYEVSSFSGRLFFTIWYNSNNGVGVLSDPLPSGQFVHFAATLDDNTGRLAIYVNGALVRQNTATATQRANAAPGATVKIGDIDGITDELSVYNRALLDSEILAIYNAGNAGTGAAGKCLGPSTPITIQSNPVGRTVSIDGGAAVTTPHVVNWTPGSVHTIATTSPQAGGAGTQFIWSNWSDGGAISHSVTAPAGSATYTANFTAQFMLTTSAGTGGSVQPASGFFNSGQTVQISALANAGFSFTGWTGIGPGSFTGNTNPVSVTMNGPITQTASFSQNPVQITVQTNPAGRLVSIDGGSAVPAPQLVQWQPGSVHTIATTSPQAGATGTQFIWSSWSDGGAISHSVTTPAVNTTYTANFNTQFMLTMNAGTGGSVQPASGFFNSGQSVQISALANPGFSFTGWTGTGTGSFTGNTNPVSVTMNGPISETAAFNQNPVQITVQTNPAGRQVSIDGGSAVTAPQVVQWLPGSVHTIATTSPQAGPNGSQFIWSNWSDGGAIAHSVTTPAVNTTYTANFNTEFLLKLMLEEAGSTSNQVAALDAVLFLRDPFPVINPANFFNLSNDRNTRLLIFVGNLQLTPGESPGSVVVNLVASDSQTYDIAAENVWTGTNSDFSQVTFRLPDGIVPGTCTITVKLHGLSSNTGTIRIGP